MFRQFGPGEILILVLLLVIVLGWKKLPDAARSVGRSMRIFKSEVEEMKHDKKPGAAANDTVSGHVVEGPAAPQDPVVPPPSAPTAAAPAAQPASQPSNRPPA